MHFSWKQTVLNAAPSCEVFDGVDAGEIYFPKFTSLTRRDPETPAAKPIYMSRGICDIKHHNNTLTCSTATAPALLMCNPQYSMCCNAALHSKLYLTPWQTSTAIRAARSTQRFPEFSEKFDTGPKPIPWLWEYVKHVLFLPPLFFTYSWLEHQLVASSQDCKAFAFTCRLTALLNCFGIYSAL